MKPAAEAFDVGRKFVRVLRATGKPVTAAKPGRRSARERRPTMHVASAPGQVWCWDMTYLPSYQQRKTGFTERTIHT